MKKKKAWTRKSFCKKKFYCGFQPLQQEKGGSSLLHGDNEGAFLGGKAQEWNEEWTNVPYGRRGSRLSCNRRNIQVGEKGGERDIIPGAFSVSTIPVEDGALAFQTWSKRKQTIDCSGRKKKPDCDRKATTSCERREENLII